MQMGTIDAMQFLLDKMKDAKSNEDFFAIDEPVTEPHVAVPFGLSLSKRCNFAGQPSTAQGERLGYDR